LLRSQHRGYVADRLSPGEARAVDRQECRVERPVLPADWSPRQGGGDDWPFDESGRVVDSVMAGALRDRGRVCPGNTTAGRLDLFKQIAKYVTW
jgi:hypothetical protein